MRDPKRITEFCERLAEIWATQCPDWRFGQLIINVFGTASFDPFFHEEKDMIELFEKYFHLGGKTDAETQCIRKENNRSESGSTP